MSRSAKAVVLKFGVVQRIGNDNDCAGKTKGNAFAAADRGARALNTWATLELNSSKALELISVSVLLILCFRRCDGAPLSVARAAPAPRRWAGGVFKGRRALMSHHCLLGCVNFIPLFKSLQLALPGNF
ncbi:hypothetical protein EVAR_40453_1 [Eumeta japonica]|uniref:Uncharacterized protein n=1 Tax=Eumeta variegata TaxID=151549 RepID=A0A4C1X0J2_EUMVA|nr:hypothetical protein EVAR_40453_1 [Eumeta japonica]